MSILPTHHYFDRHDFILVAKTAFVLLGLAVLGYFAFGMGGNSQLSPDSVFDSAAASQMSISNASPGTADAQSRGAATTAVPPDVDRAFDYFPDHYVNQATKVEEPVATF